MRLHSSLSVFVFADISVKSSRKLFLFIITNNIYRIKVSRAKKVFETKSLATIASCYPMILSWLAHHRHHVLYEHHLSPLCKCSIAISFDCELRLQALVYFSRNIRWVTPKIIYCIIWKKSFPDQGIQKIVNLILKTEALVVSHR